MVDGKEKEGYTHTTRQEALGAVLWESSSFLSVFSFGRAFVHFDREKIFSSGIFHQVFFHQVFSSSLFRMISQAL
ncbi:MAG: hypothetical protein IIZ39_05465 [Blautia sp.]|nr:hypothetical protein [Blautia sp.]